MAQACFSIGFSLTRGLSIGKPIVCQSRLIDRQHLTDPEFSANYGRKASIDMHASSNNILAKSLPYANILNGWVPLGRFGSVFMIEDFSNHNASKKLLPRVDSLVLFNAPIFNWP